MCVCVCVCVVCDYQRDRERERERERGGGRERERERERKLYLKIWCKKMCFWVKVDKNNKASPNHKICPFFIKNYGKAIIKFCAHKCIILKDNIPILVYQVYWNIGIPSILEYWYIGNSFKYVLVLPYEP